MVDEPSSHVSLRTVRALCPSLRDDRLRYLEQWGLVRPTHTSAGPQFGFADIALLRRIEAELAAGSSFRRILKHLASEQAGQLRLRFTAPTSAARPADVVNLAARFASGSGLSDHAQREAERHFSDAAAIDHSDPAGREAALLRYRTALAFAPDLVPALVNLGNLHYEGEAFPEAEALYRRACALDPTSVEAWFNLGNLCHDLRRFVEAASCYEATLRLDPLIADAHFYLAVTHEKLGDSAMAQPHWRRYLDLAPDGEWAALAREFAG